ncbi:MAG: exodeoxyribonuclease VII large subunit [Chlamydiia bacterium]
MSQTVSPSPAIDLPVLSVSELTQSIRQELEGRFPVVYVQGEITNFKQHTSGHLYFSLKDEEAQISAVMFAGNARTLVRRPENGDKVIARAQLSVYPARGNYQLYVKEIHYVGLGQLLAQLQALKEQLRAMGWFDAARKRPLPFLPRRIGVITSPTGAVIQDILHVLSRRFKGFSLVLYPVRVQGEGAALEIAQAIDQMNQYGMADVLIVGRGGGSLEDLWAFNELPVIEAIHRSAIPVISAVGHETDVTLADFVADVRAPTPSAAAELVMASQEELLQRLQTQQQQLRHGLRNLLTRARQRLSSLERHPALTAPSRRLIHLAEELDTLAEAIEQDLRQHVVRWQLRLHGRQQQLLALNPSRRLLDARRRLQQLDGLLEDAIQRRLDAPQQHLKACIETLAANWSQRLHAHRLALQTLSQRLSDIDPRHLLRKGYSLVFNAKTGSVILSVEQLAIGDRIALQLANGQAQAIIETITQES